MFPKYCEHVLGFSVDVIYPTRCILRRGSERADAGPVYSLPFAHESRILLLGLVGEASLVRGCIPRSCLGMNHSRDRVLGFKGKVLCDKELGGDVLRRGRRSFEMYREG